jgi:hypothetical protein
MTNEIMDELTTLFIMGVSQNYMNGHG